MSEVVGDILNLLKEGDEHISLGAHKDVVLVLGVTGSGKTTLTQHICGDNRNLVSVEVGSGEYIIHDSNNKISRDSTILSKTLFPDLTIDSEGGRAFYDCPGFSDTRSTAMDLAASYFIHKVTDHVASVKLLFVVNYHSVRFGVDRLDFMRLVKHAAEFIKNMDKFSDSIAFIVTKVDNNFIFKKNKPILVSDDKIIDNIGKFLEQAKLSIHELGIDSKPYFSNALKFIDILLTKKDGKYSRIGLFRRPPEDGILSDIELLQEGKKSLQHIIYDNIKFTLKDETDFGFTISEDSRNNITGVVESINKRIASSMNSVGKEIEDVLYNLEVKYSDILTVGEKYSGARESLSELITTASGAPDKVVLIQNIYKSAVGLGLRDGASVLHNINYVKQLNFLEQVSEAELNIRPLDWIRPFGQVVSHFDNLQLWYRFLIDLHFRLNDHELQSDSLKYKIYEFRNQTSNWINSGETVSIEKMSKFLHIIFKNLETKGYDRISNFMIDRFRLLKLRDILSLSLNNFISKCTDDGLQISGYNIILKKVNLGVCGSVKVVKMFALNKIFVDKDIDKTGGNMSITMIAPYWEVVGERRIILDGDEGQGLGKAQNAHVNGYAGFTGSPGVPGGNGGHFLGVGHTFKNGKNLLISVSGGRGGPGQEGGDGAVGNDGLSPKKETIDQFNKEETDNNKLILLVYNKFGYDYKIEGKEGGHGGNGGHGGIGGLGGFVGSIRMEELGDEKSEFIPREKNGLLGVDGKGGKGGAGGRYGHECKADRSEKYILFIPIGDSFNSLYCSVSGKTAPSGKHGQDGYNHKGRQNQYSPNSLPNYPLILDTYKNYSSQNTVSVIKDPVATDFFNKLNRFNKSNHRVRRVANFQNVYNHPVESSANGLNSPINSIIHWVKYSLFPLSGLNSVGNWIRGISSAQFGQAAGDSSVTRTTGAFDLSSSLLLADLLIRKYVAEGKQKCRLADYRDYVDSSKPSHHLAYSYYCNSVEDLLHQSTLQYTLS